MTGDAKSFEQTPKTFSSGILLANKRIKRRCPGKIRKSRGGRCEPLRPSYYRVTQTTAGRCSVRTESVRAIAASSYYLLRYVVPRRHAADTQQIIVLGKQNEQATNTADDQTSASSASAAVISFDLRTHKRSTHARANEHTAHAAVLRFTT